MLKLKILLIILISLLFNISNGQVLDKIPLSRQDSALIDKYKLKSNEQLGQNNLKEASDFYNQIAMLYWEHNHFNNAVEFYEKSLKINSSLGNENGIAMINSNLALLYADMKKYKEALDKFTKTYSIRKAKREKVGTISALINMSVVLNNLNQYNISIKHLKEALDIAREMSDINQMKSCYGMLSETYEKYGKADSAFYYFNYYKTFNEMVHEKKLSKTQQELENERLKAQLAESESQKKELELYKNKIELQKKENDLTIVQNEKGKLLASLSKKELQLRLVQKSSEIEQLKSNNEIQKRKKIEIIIFGVAGFLGILTALLYYYYYQKKKTNKSLKLANDIINKKNDNIISSLNYAKYLQNTMLRKTNELNELVVDSFIIYEPKDIVGGDFYWFTECNGKIVIAAIDCTGHGVPGAFLTIISNNLLNQIVKKDNILDPSEILNKMDQGIIEILDQRITDNSDGMAVGIVTIENDKCYYAGAENRLFVAIDCKVEIYKGYRFGLGGVYLEDRNFEKNYKTHEIPLRKGMALYLSSDGFMDQLGGESMKKIKTSGFVKIIESICDTTMNEQEKILNKYFQNWKAGIEQMDDVLILGFRV